MHFLWAQWVKLWAVLRDWARLRPRPPDRREERDILAIETSRQESEPRLPSSSPPSHTSVPGAGNSTDDSTIPFTETCGTESIKTACLPSPSSFDSFQKGSEAITTPITIGGLPLLGIAVDRISLERANSQASTMIHSGRSRSNSENLDDLAASGIPSRDSATSVGRGALPSETSLRGQLYAVQIESPRGTYKYFIPRNEIERLVTAESTLAELARSGVQFADDDTRQNTVDRILKSAVNLFVILVRLKLSHLITEFLGEGDKDIDDTHLPFSRNDTAVHPARFQFFSGKNEKQVIRCMLTWDTTSLIDFGREQWCALSPTLEYLDDDVKHYDLHDNCVLPFVENGERGDRTKQGGYGSVWKEVVHPAHQKVHGSDKQKLACRVVAVKRLHLPDVKCFRAEVEILKLLRKRPHAHLVNLLATFSWKQRYYLLFPYADSNLREYWKQTSHPDFSLTTVSWILHQCRAVTSALQMVHNNQNTTSFVAYANTSDPDSDTDERVFGRHGDVKAENILWFAGEGTDGRGVLVVADFGLTAFHKKTSRSKVKSEYVTGSPSYEPPELMLHSHVSRAYDIWSLGCLYLEMITWLLCGWEALRRFPQARGRTASPPELNDDVFFTIVEEEGSGPRAEVRQSVQDWMQDLHEMPRCSKFIHEFLNIISEQMLVPNPLQRIPIGQLNLLLSQMVKKAASDPLYLTAPNPSRHRKQQSSSQSLTKFIQDGDAHSLDPLAGDPLPRRSSPASDTSETSQPMPRLQFQNLSDISPPSSPKLGD